MRLILSPLLAWDILPGLKTGGGSIVGGLRGSRPRLALDSDTSPLLASTADGTASRWTASCATASAVRAAAVHAEVAPLASRLLPCSCAGVSDGASVHRYIYI